MNTESRSCSPITVSIEFTFKHIFCCTVGISSQASLLLAPSDVIHEVTICHCQGHSNDSLIIYVAHRLNNKLHL